MQRGLLSSIWGKATKGYAYDTPLCPLDVMDRIAAPDALSNTAVLASTPLTADPQVIKTNITHPDVPRALIVKGNQASVTGNVKIVGRDVDGFDRTEVIAANGASAVVGFFPFAKVFRIELPELDTAGDEISIGISDKLGLKRVPSAGAVFEVEVNGVGEAAAAVDYTNATFTPTTVPNASRNYRVYYSTKII